MDRYQTRRYVAVSWAEARRLAQLDGTPFDEIRHVADVELIHRTDWWAWWSDERLTTAIGVPEDLRPSGLSADAEELITDAWASDSASPQCGWAVLVQIQRIVNQELISVSLQVERNRLITWERLTITFQDGQQSVLYRVWTGYEDGYLFDIRIELPEGLID